MFSDEYLLKNFGRSQYCSINKKYKWYTISAINIDYDVILNDDFWEYEEKDIIRSLLNGAKIENWFIVRRTFRLTWLDICIIYTAVPK